MTPDKKTYKEVIEMLREQQHIARDAWEEIAEELDFADHFAQLKPHRVEKELWTGIEETLTKEEAVANPKWQISTNWLRYAAAGLLLLGVGLWVLQNQQGDFYAYHSEVEYGVELEVADDLQDATFAKGTSYLSENSFLFSEAELNEYQTELQELEAAIAEIQAMQEQYGVDAAGMKSLAKMERQKATLIKSMINQP